jgi:hypothetical protein
MATKAISNSAHISRKKRLDLELPLMKESFNRWFLGNTEAISFCLGIVKSAHLWDDLIDKDNDYTDKEVHDVFSFLMFEMPSNPFYIRHQRELSPIMMSILLKWHTANIFEKERQEGDINKAFVLRAELYQLFVICAVLTGGREWGIEVSPTIWRSYGELFEDFKQEIDNA